MKIPRQHPPESYCGRRDGVPTASRVWPCFRLLVLLAAICLVLAGCAVMGARPGMGLAALVVALLLAVGACRDRESLYHWSATGGIVIRAEWPDRQ